MPEVTDPELLRQLNASTPTLQERRVNADIGQSGASAESSHESAVTERELRPYKVKEAAADATKAEDAAAASRDEAAKRGDAAAATIRSLRNVIDKIDLVGLDAADNNGWFETGASGEFARTLPSWVTLGATRPAHDLAANLATIDANTAFSELQKMRDNSPTGGALGQVTERELDLLKSSVASLDPDQSQPQFLTNLATVKRNYLDMLRRLDPDAAKEYETAPGFQFRDGKVMLVPHGANAQSQIIDPIGNIDGPAPSDGSDDASPSGPSGGGGGDPAPSGGGWTVNGVVKRLGEGAGSVVEGIGDIPGMLGGNLLGNGWNAILRRYGYSAPERYDMGETLRSALGLPDNPEQTNDAIIKGAASALTGSAGAKGLASLLSPSPIQRAAQTLGAQPVRDMVAGAAAGGGSETAQQMGGGPLAQIGGAVAGGAVGYGGANALNSLVRAKAPTELAELASKYGVNFLPADTDSAVAKLATGAAKVSPISAPTVVKGAQAAQDSLRNAASRIAQSQGEVPTTDVAGQWLREAAKRYTAKTQDIGNTNYQRAWTETGDLNIPARNADAKILEFIRQLRKAPERNAAQISELQQLRRDLSRGQTAESLHALRSDLRQGVYDGKLRSGPEQARFKSIGEAITGDMLGFLDGVGLRNAANRIRKADSYWKDRVEQIDQVLQPILGRNEQIGGEQIVQRVESMARGKFGGNKRLSRLLSNMTEPERAQVRGTIIDRLGRATEGAEGPDSFSAGRFIQNWEKMTPQGKASLFPDGGLRKSLDDIAKLSKGMQSSERISKIKPFEQGALQGNIGLQVGWAMAHLPSYLAGAGAQYITGKMLASPKFARLLAKAPTVKDPRTFIEQLGTIGTREPLLHADITSFQKHLIQSLNASPPRVMASEEEQN